MTPDELKVRCKALIDSIYGPRAEGNVGTSYDEYVQEAESLCREMIGKAFSRSMSIIEVCIWEYAPGSPEIHALRGAVDRIKTEAQRVKEGGQ